MGPSRGHMATSLVVLSRTTVRRLLIPARGDWETPVGVTAEVPRPELIHDAMGRRLEPRPR